MPGPDELRAGDADRDRVAERLREALAEGRLDAAEFQDRLDACYHARTLGELVPLTGDLPPGDFYPTPRPLAPEHPASGAVEPAGAGSHLIAQLSLWGAVFAIANVVWILRDSSGGYWPGWLFIWLAVLIAGGARRTLPSGPRGQRRGRELREAARAHRRELRQRRRRRPLP